MMNPVRWQCEVLMKWFEMMECRSSKSNIHIFWRRKFLWISYSDIGKYFWILNIDSIQIFQDFEMSSYLIHSSMFNRDQFRVLIDWFDFIHRCFFHSRWSCLDQALNLFLWFDVICSVISHWLGTFRLFVWCKPILVHNSWFYNLKNIDPAWSCRLPLSFFAKYNIFLFITSYPLTRFIKNIII